MLILINIILLLNYLGRFLLGRFLLGRFLLGRFLLGRFLLGQNDHKIKIPIHNCYRISHIKFQNKMI